MQLSKLGYYSDFVVYPVVVTGFAVAALAGADWQAAVEWVGAAMTGVALWTLMEYVFHRMAFHRIAILVPLHGAHHKSPLAFVGTPTWMSVLALLIGIFVPAYFGFGFTAASGLTAGVMLGYFWYGVVHHVIHHHANKPSRAYFSALRAWHMRHHYSTKSGNFGVTTALWDHVFGTAISRPGRHLDSQPH
jgi:sterol desaturase/sphingolipid hydroxylase (fatty acid hydroxylase superfamily)